MQRGDSGNALLNALGLPPKASSFVHLGIAVQHTLTGQAQTGLVIVWRKSQPPALKPIQWAGFTIDVHSTGPTGAQPLAIKPAAVTVVRAEAVAQHCSAESLAFSNDKGLAVV